MKKSFLFSLVISAFCFTANAQTNVYHPFPDTNAIWAWRYWDLYSYPAGEVRNGMRGDTIINGKNYKKIYSIRDTTITDLPYAPSTYYAAIREQNKRIYTVIDTSKEQLLYDFNLLVGDTITYHYSLGIQGIDTFSRVVTAIDSILLLDGKYRKRWSLASSINCSFSDIVVEGVGSVLIYDSQGLFTPLYNYDCTCSTVSQFTCFKNNDTTLYVGNTLCNKCFCSLLTGIDNVEDKQTQINISPNPSNGKFILKMDNGQLSINNYQLSIYNVMGEKVKEATINTQSTIVNLNSPSGIYFYQIKDKEQIIGNGKLIINHN